MMGQSSIPTMIPAMILVALAMAALLAGFWMKSKALVVAAALFFVLYLWKFQALVGHTRPAPSPPSNAAWEPAPEAVWAADVYPSIELAARAVAEQFKDKLCCLSPGGPETLKRISIASSDSPEAARVLASSLRRLYPRAAIVEARPSLELEKQDGNVHVRLEIMDKATLAAAVGEANIQGILKATAIGSSDSTMASAGFSSHAWAADFQRFHARHANRPYFAAWSADAAASHDEAFADARSRAIAYVASVLEMKLRPVSGYLRGKDHQRIFRQAEQAVLSGQVVEDQFVQSFQHSYGKTWRAGLLLDVSPTRMDPMRQSLTREIGSDHQRSRSSAFAVVGIAAVISLLYLFLNAATRGYFRSSLQWGAVAILVIGALMVMAIA
jgi:hypothetical protein